MTDTGNAGGFAPVLDSARLTLRGHRPGDLAECAAMWADPEVVRHIGGRPFSGEDVWARLLRYVGHWTLFGFGFWVIREKASGRFVGEAGFADFRRDIDPPFGEAPEIGWALARWAHGQGFATEAVRAVVAWGEARFGAVRTVCIIDPGNRASMRVAEKCGYRQVRQSAYKGESVLIFER